MFSGQLFKQKRPYRRGYSRESTVRTSRHQCYCYCASWRATKRDCSDFPRDICILLYGSPKVFSEKLSNLTAVSTLHSFVCVQIQQNWLWFNLPCHCRWGEYVSSKEDGCLIYQSLWVVVISKTASFLVLLIKIALKPG